MKTTEQGRLAETIAAQHLENQGFRILDRNWRTRLCEIDLVAWKDGAVHFIEVKYRAGDNQGDGLDYITGAKQRQMQFAGELWIQRNGWTGDWRLSAVSMSGEPPDVIEIIDISA